VHDQEDVLDDIGDFVVAPQNAPDQARDVPGETVIDVVERPECRGSGPR
jgi:hypothetical protein